MTKQFSQAGFDKVFRYQIEKFTLMLVSALRKIIATKVPPTVGVLSFEIEPDWREFPIYILAMDEKVKKLAYFEPPFTGFLLPNAGKLIPDDAIDQVGHEKAGVATYESGAKVMAEWFGKCWHAAGGAEFHIPAYINLHDSSEYFNLKEQRWVSNADIWP